MYVEILCKLQVQLLPEVKAKLDWRLNLADNFWRGQRHNRVPGFFLYLHFDFIISASCFFLFQLLGDLPSISHLRKWVR